MSAMDGQSSVCPMYCGHTLCIVSQRPPKRHTGRPRGSCDLLGKARRVTRDELAGYAVTIGRRIRDLRLERGIAVSELAEACSVNPSTLHRLEQVRATRGNPPNVMLSTIVRIARALNVQPSELLP